MLLSDLVIQHFHLIKSLSKKILLLLKIFELIFLFFNFINACNKPTTKHELDPIPLLAGNHHHNEFLNHHLLYNILIFV